jgi:hypothetical protein
VDVVKNLQQHGAQQLLRRKGWFVGTKSSERRMVNKLSVNVSAARTV